MRLACREKFAAGFFTIFRNFQVSPLYKSKSLPPNNPPPEQSETDTHSVFRFDSLNLTPSLFSSVNRKRSTSDVIHEIGRETLAGARERETQWNKRSKA
jgi:triacylglycerol esterase/lipase EstA (alpha/beta hydrolase family)